MVAKAGIELPVNVREDRVARIPLWARARKYSEEALNLYVRVMRDGDEPTPIRIQAAGVILDRGWGKAPIMVAGDQERPIRVDVRAIAPQDLEKLELLLMKALGEGIAGEIAGRTEPGGVVDGEYAEVAIQPPASGTLRQPNGNTEPLVIRSPSVRADARGGGEGSEADGGRDGEG